MRRECRERFPRHLLQRNRWLAIHHASRHVHDAHAVMHVGIANPRYRENSSRHSRCMHNPQVYVSGKRPIVLFSLHTANTHIGWKHICLPPFTSSSQRSNLSNPSILSSPITRRLEYNGHLNILIGPRAAPVTNWECKYNKRPFQLHSIIPWVICTRPLTVCLERDKCLRRKLELFRVTFPLYHAW